MMVTKSDIQKALRKAKRAYDKGVRYYDTKHNTYNPAWKSDNDLYYYASIRFNAS